MLLLLLATMMHPKAHAHAYDIDSIARMCVYTHAVVCALTGTQTNFAPMLATAAKAQLGAPAASAAAPGGAPAPKKESDKHHIVLMELLAKELGVQVGTWRGPAGHVHVFEGAACACVRTCMRGSFVCTCARMRRSCMCACVRAHTCVFVCEADRRIRACRGGGCPVLYVCVYACLRLHQRAGSVGRSAVLCAFAAFVDPQSCHVTCFKCKCVKLNALTYSDQKPTPRGVYTPVGCCVARPTAPVGCCMAWPTGQLQLQLQASANQTSSDCDDAT